jgi:5-hydroxyisourate hydrolase-like protein (transthyretin family)
MSSRLESPVSLARTWLKIVWLLAVLAWPGVAAAQNGTVSGTVTEAGTNTPLANVGVTVMTVRFSPVSSAITNAAGFYSISVPPGALYYVFAQAADHVITIQPNVPCSVSPGCQTDDLLLGTPFAMLPAGVVPNRNISMARAGRITGTVTSTAGGAPIANAVIGVFSRSGAGFGFGTNAAGLYTASELGPGTWFVATFLSNSEGFRNEIYNDIPCIGGCSTTAILGGTPVVVTGGATAAARDFALEPGGRITGVVTNSLTSAPLANVSVIAVMRVGGTVFSGGSATTNATGQYTIAGLAAGTYSLLTSSGTTTNEIYPDILCPINCSTTTAADSGRGVAVSLNATTPNINFALSPGGTISGTVTNQVTGLPASAVQVIAAIRQGPSTFTRQANTDASGNYSISGLPDGTYAVFTNSVNFQNKIFDNIICPAQSCVTATAIQTGTPVNVTAGGNASGRNFTLLPLATGATGTISGTITDSVNGLPVAGIQVEIDQIIGTTATRITTRTTDVLGQYSAPNLVPGSYRVATLGHTPYRNEAFDNFPCLGLACPAATLLSATPVAVTGGGIANVNMAISAGDGLDGVVTDAVTGAPLPSVNVTFFQVPAGTMVTTFTTDALGRYKIRGLPNGQYVVFTSNSLGYFDEIYNNIRCTPTCSSSTAVSSGTRVTLNGAAPLVGGEIDELVSGVNFALDVRTDAPNAPTNFRIVTSGGTAQFAWTAPSLSGGGAPTSYLLEAGGSPGTTFITLPIPGTGTTFSVPGVPPGTYFVRVRGVNGGGTGPASNEVTLVVGAGGTGRPDPPTNVTPFVSGSFLTLTWSPALGGGPAADYVLEAGTASRLANIAALPVSGTVFTFSGVPPGVYFLRVRGRNAAGLSQPSTELMLVVGNVPAPPSAPSFTSHTVSSGTVTLNWTAPTFGTPTSYIIEAGSATGLSNLASFNTGNTGLTLSFSGVPPGTYYVRIRAVNAQGASVVSNERVIVVS